MAGSNEGYRVERAGMNNSGKARPASKELHVPFLKSSFFDFFPDIFLERFN